VRTCPKGSDDVHLKPKTIKSYNQLYSKHIAPTLGPIKLQELRRSDVRALLTAKTEEVYKTTKCLKKNPATLQSDDSQEILYV
jgi:hypothetical protein